MPLTFRNDSSGGSLNQKESSDEYIINPLLALQRQQNERATIHFMDEQQTQAQITRELEQARQDQRSMQQLQNNPALF